MAVEGITVEYKKSVELIERAQLVACDQYKMLHDQGFFIAARIMLRQAEWLTEQRARIDEFEVFSTMNYFWSKDKRNEIIHDLVGLYPLENIGG